MLNYTLVTDNKSNSFETSRRSAFRDFPSHWIGKIDQLIGLFICANNKATAIISPPGDKFYAYPYRGLGYYDIHHPADIERMSAKLIE